MFAIVGTLMLLTLVGESKSEVNRSNQFIQRVIDCYFTNNSIEFVELICNNTNKNYVRDNCYSILFKDELRNINRSKVKYLKTGRCQSEIFDISLAEIFPKIISLDISYLGYKNLFQDTSSKAESFNFEKLQKLNASYNEIGAIDDMFDYTENINEIDLSHNKIRSIFAESFKTTDAIKVLNLSYNSIVSLEVSSLVDMGQLLVIDLSDNLLETFDMGLFIRNAELEVIHLENNRIKRLTFAMNFMPVFETLTFFSAARNQIDNFNEIIIQCLGINLQVLDLSGNFLDNLNSSMFVTLKNLQRLNFSHTNLTKFDFNAFKHPENVISIDLSGNQLNELNLSLKHNFSRLKEIFLQENDLNELKNFSILTLPKLQRIGISRNWFSCDYATDFVQQWAEIDVIGNTCEQKTNGKDIESHLILYVIIAVVISLFGIICAAVWIFRWNALSRTQHDNEQSTQQTTEYFPPQNIDQNNDSNSQHSSHTDYEEPVYCEIGEPQIVYNHLNFNLQPLSPNLLHYDHLGTFNRYPQFI